MFSMTDENWRKQNKNLPARLKTILHQQIFTDVVIVVRGKEFKCHRLILALGSPYFERTFYHTFRNTDFPPITLSDITPEAFQCVLSLLYTDKVTFGSENQAFQTYEAAEKFQIDDLKLECEIYLSELDVRPQTVWKSLERAMSLRMEKMERKHMSYIEKNTYDCLHDSSFLSTSEDIVLKIMTSEKLAVDEFVLLTQLVAWGKHTSKKEPKLFLRPFLAHARFRALSPKAFSIFVKAYPDLIDSHESLQILKHLESPTKASLPTWCCRFPRRIWPD